MSHHTGPLRILHTAAHPADAFDMVGGTLAHHVRRGDRVTVVVFTQGASSHALKTIQAQKAGEDAPSLDDAIDEKQGEVVEACGILGIEDVRFFRYNDHLLLLKEESIRKLAEIIREVRPDVMITHSPFEQMGMPCAHRVCCELSMMARGMASGIMDHDSRPHSIGEVFYMWQHGETTLLDYAVPRFPMILIDVTDVVDLKVKALDRIASQYYSGGLGRKVLETVNGSHATHMCVPYAEAFLRHYPEVHDHLPVCEHNLRLVREPLAKTYERLGKFIVPNVPEDDQPS